MPIYSIDPHHPDRLRCDDCGHAVADLTHDTCVPEPDELRGLSPERAARCWPRHAGEVLAHALACAWWEASRAFCPDGVGVRVYLPSDGEG